MYRHRPDGKRGGGALKTICIITNENEVLTVYFLSKIKKNYNRCKNFDCQINQVKILVKSGKDGKV